MSKIEITIDKRIELISALLLLAECEDNYVLAKCEHNEEYRQKILDDFKAYKNEGAIIALKDWISKISFGVSGVVSTLSYFALLFDDKWNFHVECDEFYNKLHWLDFAEAVKGFVKKTDFDGFYNNNLNMYQGLIERTKETAQLEKTEEFLAEFYGEDFTNKPKHILNLTLIITNVGYGLTTYLNEDFCICSIDSKGKELRFIGTERGGSRAVHEFSHPIINPLVEKYCDYEKDFYNNISARMSQLGYNGNYPAGITMEHIARAMQVLYIKIAFKNKPEMANAQLRQVVDGAGFKYAPLFVESLEYFYNNRSKYKNFEEYLPTLLEYVKQNKDLVDRTKPL